MCGSFRGVDAGVLFGRAPNRSLNAWRWLPSFVSPMVLLGCGGDDGGAPTLTWYINPDNGGQATLAEKCADASDGAYTHRDPGPAERRRRAARAAGAAPGRRRLLDRPDEPRPAVRRRVRQRRLPAADHRPGRRRAAHRRRARRPRSRPRTGTTSSSRRRSGRTPSCSGTASRWPRRRASTRRAGDFTWDEMIDAAESQGKRIGVQGRRYEGYMVWINALIASGGGADHRERRGGRRGHADGRVAGRATRPPRSSAAWPARRRRPPTCRPPARRRPARCSRATTASSWSTGPTSTRRPSDAVERARSTSRWSTTSAGPATRRSTAGRPARRRSAASTSPSATSPKHPDEALAAVKCITSLESNTQYMVESGNPAARAAAYDDPAVREAFPMADLIRESIDDAGPRPITPYYGDVSTSVQRTWHPPDERAGARARPRRPTATWPTCCSGERLL